MDIACFIPLHFNYQDSGPLALPRTDWHCNDTCLLVDSSSTALSSKPNNKRNIYQTSSFESSHNKRQCHPDMLPRRRSSTNTRPAAATRRRASQQQDNDSSLSQQSRRRRSVQNHHYQQHQPQQSLSSTPSSSSMPSSVVQQDVSAVSSIEDDLHHLQDEWATIDIVFHSLRNAFTTHPVETATEEHLDEVDRELSIAYDDIKAQVRHLERSLRRLDNEISTFRPPQAPTTSTNTNTPSTTSIVPENPTTSRADDRHHHHNQNLEG
ncbi:hypothetical protein INT45_000428 [Circinella minor]|uniref:Uncharacterized protein n=1 Tax=Circinella minor TaxID=1195481 RepID=A0A8H7RWW6_9FUNG|nr:hypothetical protein INT45_000428 [Circinella minor]